MRYLLAVIMLSVSVASAQESLSAEKALVLGRTYTAALYANDVATLWPPMTDRMKESMKSAANFGETNGNILKRIGKETLAVKDLVMPNQQYLMYTRLAEFEKVPVRVVVTFTFSRDGQIAGFFVTPEPNVAESNHLAYKDKASFRLPFSGEWTVFQGGRLVFENYHAVAPDQRFAYDFMVIKNAYQYANKGWKLTDFYSYGRPISAPAAGTVVSAVDEYDDNEPLKPSKDAPPQGNSIVIDHGNGEFSMLAHFQHGSLKVKTGDKVTAGQLLGLCGNSGNSPIPHLHYHVQNTPTWSKGEGLPIQFHDYVSNGKPIEVSEPVRGEVLQPK